MAAELSPIGQLQNSLAGSLKLCLVLSLKMRLGQIAYKQTDCAVVKCMLKIPLNHMGIGIDNSKPLLHTGHVYILRHDIGDPHPAPANMSTTDLR
ncbi:hypothetical protein E2C01_019270 [Portunus trituberculatus]|uniref:Uncharacterized protein n=1 Tax=Portunus trituberculatus TaxID=210409 RepID=A0A5B7DXF5_PORTR|nr:hypothetical protein [Portunus trituberculatus]